MQSLDPLEVAQEGLALVWPLKLLEIKARMFLHGFQSFQRPLKSRTLLQDFQRVPKSTPLFHAASKKAQEPPEATLVVCSRTASAPPASHARGPTLVWLTEHPNRVQQWGAIAHPFGVCKGQAKAFSEVSRPLAAQSCHG